MKPAREHVTDNQQTYFVTATTWQRRALFNNARWADLFLETLQSYRGRGYLLHEYVLMPEHFHILITPVVTLERAVQFIKGGFSFRVKKELQSGMEVWQRGFSDHRIRDLQDFGIMLAMSTETRWDGNQSRAPLNILTAQHFWAARKTTYLSG